MTLIWRMVRALCADDGEERQWLAVVGYLGAENRILQQQLSATGRRLGLSDGQRRKRTWAEFIDQHRAVICATELPRRCATFPPFSGPSPLLSQVGSTTRPSPDQASPSLRAIDRNSPHLSSRSCPHEFPNRTPSRRSGRAWTRRNSAPKARSAENRFVGTRFAAKGGRRTGTSGRLCRARGDGNVQRPTRSRAPTRKKGVR